MTRNRILVDEDGSSWGKVGTPISDRDNCFVGDIAVVHLNESESNSLGIVVQDPKNMRFDIYGFGGLGLKNDEYTVINRDAKFDYINAELIDKLSVSGLELVDLSNVDDCMSKSIEVSFSDAIETMKRGKKDIKCILYGDEFIYYANILNLLEHSTEREQSFAISIDEILNGKWYIINK